CADDPVAARLGRATGAITYGETAGADYRMVGLRAGREGSGFTLVHDGMELGAIRLPVPGRYNALNAAGALVIALELGASFPAASRALAHYGGVARRFEFRGERDGITFVDDYAHLPGEVAHMIDAAREGDWAHVIVVFQPHR